MAYAFLHFYIFTFFLFFCFFVGVCPFYIFLFFVGVCHTPLRYHFPFLSYCTFFSCHTALDAVSPVPVIASRRRGNPFSTFFFFNDFVKTQNKKKHQKKPYQTFFNFLIWLLLSSTLFITVITVIAKITMYIYIQNKDLRVF